MKALLAPLLLAVTLAGCAAGIQMEGTAPEAEISLTVPITCSTPKWTAHRRADGRIGVLVAFHWPGPEPER